MSDSSESLRRATELLRFVAAAGVAAATWRYATASRSGPPQPGSPEPTPLQRAAIEGEIGDGTEGRSHGARPQDEIYAPHIQIDESRESTAAATGTAVAHVLARPDSIRQRALNAATISSAVIAALAVASVTQIAGTETESWRTWTLAAVIVAPVLWIVTVGAFVRVVTLGPSREVEGPGYQALVDAYEEYSNALRRLLRVAARWSVVALLVTALAVGSVVIERNYVRERERQLVLTPTGMSAVASLCGWREEMVNVDRRVNVSVSSDELSNEIVEMDVLSRPASPGAPPTECAAATPEMRVPRSAILAAGDLQRR